MFDFELKSQEHHMKGPTGGPLCGAPLQGFVSMWEDETMVTCKRCLEKLKDDRLRENE